MLEALLVELSRGPRPTDPTSKQILYICNGVVGALLSLEACIDLRIVDEHFPSGCVSAMANNSGKKAECLWELLSVNISIAFYTLVLKKHKRRQCLSLNDSKE